MNTMVQLRKKAQPKTYKDRMQQKAENQRQQFVDKLE
jgi:hypothetical protein